MKRKVKHMERLLLIGGGPKGLDAKLMVEWGFNIVCFDLTENIQKYHENLSKATALYEIKDDKDYDSITRTAKVAHQKHPFSNVVSFTEWGLLPCAHIVDAFGFKGNGVKAVELTVDKLRMRKELQDDGLSDIKFSEIRSYEEFQKFCKDTNYSCVLKDIFGGAKIGLVIIQEKSDLIKYKVEIELNFEKYGAMLAEEFVNGIEYSVETFSWDGKFEFTTYTKKHKIPPYNVEIGHTIPANISDSLKSSIQNYLHSCLSSLGIRYGACHSEIICSSGGIYFIETHTRPGGGNIYDLLLYAHDFDIIKTACYYASGEHQKIVASNNKAAASRFFYPCEGLYKKITGEENLKINTLVKDYHLKLPDSGYLPEIKNNRLRHCYIIASDTCDADQLDVKVDKIIGQIKFVPV